MLISAPWKKRDMFHIITAPFSYKLAVFLNMCNHFGCLTFLISQQVWVLGHWPFSYQRADLCVDVIAVFTGQPFLSCKEYFSFILQVCEIADTDDFLCKSIVCETYITILGLGLSSDQYCGEIDLETWKGECAF